MAGVSNAAITPELPHRVTQSILGPPNGDCLRACFASILDLDPATMPNFHGFNWWNRWLSWMERHGYALSYYEPASERPSETTWWIAGPESPRIPGVTHAVVMYRDQLVWDPHPDASADLDPWTTEDAIVIEATS